MHISLINPPFEERYAVGSSKSMKYVLNKVPPLGLAYLAAVLRNSGSSVKIHDFSIERHQRRVFEMLVKERPDVVGITATTPVFETVKSLTAALKKSIPGVLTVIGGAHVSALPYEVMRDELFDIGVIGEAEETFPDLARHILIKGPDNLDDINGIVYRHNGGVKITRPRRFISDLDSIPYPARDLLPALSRYSPTPASYKRLPLGIIITSRGCPHKCTFCDRSVFGNMYRKRTAENVLGETEELIGKYRAREIRFFDDCFTLDIGRTYKICAGLKKIRPRTQWTCLTTVTSVTKDLLKEMKSAGCWQVLFGLESADKDMLKRLNKGATLEQNIQAVRWAKDAGLSVRADFIVGTPGETRESLDKTLDFALRRGIDYAHFNKFVPYPGTELFKELKSSGHNFDLSRNCSITDHNGLVYVPETLSDRDYYRKFINYAHKRFYLRPEYIVKRMFALRSFEELFGQIKGLFSISFLK